MWIFEELKRAFEELKRWQTWLVLGLIGFFALLAYLVGSFAFRTDAILLFLHRTASGCRELTNGSIIFLFCGMIFFLFAALITFGELQRYFYYKQRAAHHQSKHSLKWGLIWGGIALVITIAALVFFNQYCR